MSEEDARFMRRAIAIAREAGEGDGAVPIGCVIVRDGEIIGEGANEVAEQSDPTAHAEIVAIRRATRRLGPDLRGATLYLVACVADRLQRRARAGAQHVFRGPAFRHDGFHPRCLPG